MVQKWIEGSRSIISLLLQTNGLAHIPFIIIKLSCSLFFYLRRQTLHFATWSMKFIKLLNYEFHSAFAFSPKQMLQSRAITQQFARKRWRAFGIKWWESLASNMKCFKLHVSPVNVRSNWIIVGRNVHVLRHGERKIWNLKGDHATSQ